MFNVESFSFPSHDSFLLVQAEPQPGNGLQRGLCKSIPYLNAWDQLVMHWSGRLNLRQHEKYDGKITVSISPFLIVDLESFSSGSNSGFPL
jgi:hypothetical protein